MADNFSMDALHKVIEQARNSLNAADQHFSRCEQRLTILTGATHRAQRSLGISVATINNSDQDYNYLRNINSSVRHCVQSIRQDFASSGIQYEYDSLREGIGNGQEALTTTQTSVEQIAAMVTTAREQFEADRAAFLASDDLEQNDRERTYEQIENEYTDIEKSLEALKQDLGTVSTDSVALRESLNGLNFNSVSRLCDGVEHNLRQFERDSQKIQEQLERAQEREELSRVRAGQVEHRDLGASAVEAIEAKKEIQQHERVLAEYRERLADSLTRAGESFSISPVKEELDRIAGSMGNLKDIDETLTRTEQNLDGAYVQLDSIRAGVENAKDNLETVEVSLDSLEVLRERENEREQEEPEQPSVADLAYESLDEWQERQIEEAYAINKIEPYLERDVTAPEPDTEVTPEPALNHEKGVTARQTAFDKVMESPEWADAKNGCANNPDSAQLVVDQIWRREQSEKIAQQLAGKEPVFVTVPSSTGKNTIPEALAERIIEDTGRGTHIRGEDLSEGHHALAMKHIPREQRAFVPREYEVYDNAKDIIGDRTVVLVEDVFSSGASAKAFADSLKEKGIEIETSAGLVGDSRLYPEPQLVQKLQKTIKRDKVSLNAKEVAKVLSRGQIKTVIERLNQEKTHDGKQDIARNVQGVLDSRAARHLREHSQPEVGGPEYSSRESDRHAPVSPGVQDQSRVAPEDHEHSGQMHGQVGPAAARESGRESVTEQQETTSHGRDAGSPVPNERTLVTEPEASSPEKTPEAPSPTLSPEEQAARLKLLHQVQDAFVVKSGVTGTKFHFKDDPAKTAFKDKGNAMLAGSNDDRAVKAMVMMAQAKGWDSIKVSGQPEFRAKMWMEASKAGLEVKGYKPTEIELRQLEEFRDQQNRNRIEPVVGPVDPRPALGAQNPQAPSPTAPEKPASMRDALVGKVAQSFIDSKITDPAQREAAQRLIAERLAALEAKGKTASIPVYDKNAPSQNQSERTKVVEQPRSERTR